MAMSPRLLRPRASGTTVPQFSPLGYTRLWGLTTKTGGNVSGTASSDTGYYAVKWWDNTTTVYDSGDPFSKAAASGPRVFEVFPSDSVGQPSGIFEGFDVSGNDLTQLRADNVTLASSPYVPPWFGPYWTYNPGQPSVAEQGKVSNNLLSAEALDQFYTDLDNGTGSLFVAGNPGIDADDPTIATAKGYTVFGSVPPSTSLLLNFNGTNGSTTFTDSSPNEFSVTAVGNAQISTAQAKHGSGSLAIDGYGSRATIASSSAFGLGTDDFTIEAWIWLNSLAQNNTIIDLGGYQTGVLLRLAGGSNDAAYIAGTSINWSATASLSIEQWTHIAMTRQGANVRFFVDGTQVHSATNSNDAGSSASVMIGQASHSASETYGPDDSFDGYIDDLRIVKGAALYTSNFTPPTSQLGLYP